MSRLKVGLDHGTCFLKLATSNGKEALIPNVLGEKPDLDWTPRELKIPKFLDAMEAQLDGGKSYYVGEAALKQCRGHHSVVEEGMIVDQKAAVTTGLSLLTYMLNCEGSEPLSQVDVAIGTPVRTSAKMMEDIEQGMLSTHIVRLRHIATHNEISMFSHIRNARVLPKPYGAIFAIEKDPRYAQYSDSTFCGFIVDIGQGSTDILAVEGARILLTAATTTNIAVDTFLNDLANLLTEKFNVNVDAEDLSLASQQDIISIFGREVDLTDYKDRLARDVAQQIFAVASRCLRALPIGSHATRRIVLIGGGSYLFGPYLQRMFEAKGYRNVIRPPDPLMINTRGFVQFGELAWPTTTTTVLHP